MPKKIKKQKATVKNKNISISSINNIKILNINEYTVRNIIGDDNWFYRALSYYYR